MIAAERAVPQPLVPVMRRYSKGYPSCGAEADAIDYMSLGKFLTTEHDFDAHSAQHSLPEINRRLARGDISLESFLDTIVRWCPQGIPMTIFAFDVDKHDDATAAELAEWRVGENTKVDALFNSHPGGYFYGTARGYRVVYLLPEPRYVRTVEEYAAWWHWYKASLGYLRRRFGIVGDLACGHVVWQYRGPFVKRDGVAQRPETRGDAHNIGAWAPILEPGDYPVEKSVSGEPPIRRLAPGEKPADVWEAIGQLDQAEAILKLSGRSEVGGREFEFKGNKLVIDGELTNKWIDPNDGHIGSLNGGGPTVYQFLRRNVEKGRYQATPGETLATLMELYPHLREVDERCKAERDAYVALVRGSGVQASTATGAPPASTACVTRADSKGDDAEATPGSSVPTIEDGVKEYITNTKAIAALANVSSVYQRAGHLVRIVHNKRPPKAFTRFPEAPRIDELKPPTLRELLSICANWVKFDGRAKDWVPTRPPDACVKAVLARKEWDDIRPLEGVIQTPTFLADGTVLTKQGYDPGTGLFLEGGEGIVVPDCPTKDDAIAAYKSLLEPFEEFKFISGNADACVAAILSVLAWDAFDGPSPMYYFAASTPGSGKGLAVWVISHIALGRDTAAMTAPSTEEEWGKSVLTVAIAGEPLVLLDNVRGMVKSAALEAVLTASEFAGRILGVTEKVQAALRSVWMLTGNNCSFSTDLIRRTIPIEIDPCGENPSERKFERDLKAWVPANRTRLVTAALTLLRAFYLAGCPAHGGPRKGSFESWDKLIRSAIIWVGGCDPCAGVEALRESGDGDKDSLRALLHALRDVFAGSGKTVREIIDASDSAMVRVDAVADRATLVAKADALRDALLALDPKNTSGRPSLSTLPYALRERKGQIVGELRLECEKNKRTGASLWRVTQVYKSGGATPPAAKPAQAAEIKVPA